jgi:hypothetical protein
MRTKRTSSAAAHCRYVCPGQLVRVVLDDRPCRTATAPRTCPPTPTATTHIGRGRREPAPLLGAADRGPARRQARCRRTAGRDGPRRSAPRSQELMRSQLGHPLIPEHPPCYESSATLRRISLMLTTSPARSSLVRQNSSPSVAVTDSGASGPRTLIFAALPAADSERSSWPP